jgi:pSer/pThr/pTyr-binding forkhead associated (FHA) protein
VQQPVITPVPVDADDALTIPAPGKARLDSGIPVGGGFAPAVEPDPHPASGGTARSEGGVPEGQPAMLPPDMDDIETRSAAVTGPRLVLVGRDGEEGQAFEFSGTTITIGRQHGEIAFADDPFMSPQHARVERSGEMFTLVDLGSTNGVYLRTRGNASVYPGDLFMVGHQVLRLENVTDPVAEQHPAPDGTRLFGTPLKPAWGKLALIGRGGVTGDTFYLRGAKVIFGREQGDILFPRDPFVSREHAQLRLELHGAQMSVFLEDQGSANGTYIRIRGSAEVRAGDTFRVGDQILRLRLDD